MKIFHKDKRECFLGIRSSYENNVVDAPVYNGAPL